MDRRFEQVRRMNTRELRERGISPSQRRVIAPMAHPMSMFEWDTIRLRDHRRQQAAHKPSAPRVEMAHPNNLVELVKLS